MAGTRGTRGAGGSNRHISNTQRSASGISDRASRNSASGGRGFSEYGRASRTRSTERSERARSERPVKPASSMEQAKQRRRRAKARKARQRLLIKLCALAVLVLVAWLIMHLSLKSAIGKVISDDKTIAPGITIDGLDVGGMTRQQAESAFDSYVEGLSTLEISCTTDGGSVAIPLSSFGFKQDTTTTKDLVDQAFAYGREGSTTKRYRQIKKLKKETVDFDATYTIDEQMTAQTLMTHCKVVEGAAVNAAIVHNNGVKTITESKKGIVVDTATTTKQIHDLVSAPEWEKKSCTIDVATIEAEPEITTEMLEALTDELGSYHTTYEGLSAKMQNVENGASFINAHYVMPGEIFDANAAMEPYTEDNGYTAGRSFNSGQIEETLGGGICQVSTTLYNAVLFAELEVVERANHSMLVSYVEPGRDAAIADDVKNFVFKNSTDDPIYIEAYTEDGELYTYIYGVDKRDPKRTIEYYSDITSRKECKIIYRIDYDAPFGSKETDTYGYDGVEATLYKNIYVDGVKTDTELINYSSYNLVDAVVIIGVKTDNDDAYNNLVNAIVNQDEDVINSYIY